MACVEEHTIEAEVSHPASVAEEDDEVEEVKEEEVWPAALFVDTSHLKAAAGMKVTVLSTIQASMALHYLS